MNRYRTWGRLLFLLLITGGMGRTQAPSDTPAVRTPAPVHAVRLYPGWSEIYRTTTLHLPAGVHQIWIEHLPDTFLAESLQMEVTGPPGTQFLGHQIQSLPMLDVWEAADIQDRWQAYRTLRDRLTTLETVRTLQEVERDFWTGVAESVASHSGEALRAGHLSPEILAQFADQIEQALQKALSVPAAADQRHRQVLDQAARAVLQDLDRLLRRTRRVRVDLRLPQAGPVRIGLRYLQQGDLWWGMQYRLEADPARQRIRVRAEAVVHQATPDVWQDVDLELALGHPPRRNMHIPDPPRPWVLRPYRAEKRVQTARKAGIPAVPQAATALAPVPEGTPGIRVRGAQVIQATQRVNVAPGQDYQVTLGTWELDAEMRYRVVPARSREAILVARATNTTPIPWLPGPVRLFVDGHFTGTTSMPLVQTGGTVAWPVRVHPEVEVQRRRIRRYTEQVGVLSKHKRIHLAYETRLRNNSDTPVALEILDRSPIREEEAIRLVRVLWNPKPDEWDERTGLAVWHRELAPGEEQTLTLEVVIETPPDMVLDIEKRP